MVSGVLISKYCLLFNFGGNCATNPKDTVGRKAVGKFARALLATTCLTVATGGAALAPSSSLNIVEGTAPAPGDFCEYIRSASEFFRGDHTGNYYCEWKR